MIAEDHTRLTLVNEERFPELDSLRGIASFMVVLNHFHDMWATQVPDGRNHLVKSLYLILWGPRNGAAAVVLFFVLSGFVLSLPILRGKRQPYPVFAVRRILRIYGPYFIALLFAIAGCALFYRMPHPEGWGASLWSMKPTWRSALDHVTFLGAYNWQRYDFVIWSLIQEMRISLLFPLLVTAVQRLKSYSLVPMVLLILSYRWINGTETFDTAHWRQSIAQTLFYTAFFVAGILLAANLQEARAWWRHLPGMTRTVAGAGSIFLFAYGNIVAKLFGDRYHPDWFNPMQIFTLGSVLEMLGSLGCILLALEADSLKKLLRMRACHFLGRTSYSLYLMHPIVLLTLTLTLFQSVDFRLQFPLYLAASLLLGWAFCVLVEERFIRLSRNVSSFLPRSVGGTAR